MKIEKYLNKKHFLKVAILLPILINVFYLFFVNFIPISKWEMQENFYYGITISQSYKYLQDDSYINTYILRDNLGYCPLEPTDQCGSLEPLKSIDLSKFTQKELLAIVGQTNYVMNFSNMRCGKWDDVHVDYPDSKSYELEFGYLYNTDRSYPGYSSNFFQIQTREDIEKTDQNLAVKEMIKANCNIQDSNFIYSLDSKLKFYGK